MRMDVNPSATTSYFPNSTNVWADQPELQEPPLKIGGQEAVVNLEASLIHPVLDEYFSQAVSD